jgi:hypothetical protein
MFFGTLALNVCVCIADEECNKYTIKRTYPGERKTSVVLSLQYAMVNQTNFQILWPHSSGETKLLYD